MHATCLSDVSFISNVPVNESCIYTRKPKPFWPQVRRVKNSPVCKSIPKGISPNLNIHSLQDLLSSFIIHIPIKSIHGNSKLGIAEPTSINALHSLHPRSQNSPIYITTVRKKFRAYQNTTQTALNVSSILRLHFLRRQIKLVFKLNSREPSVHKPIPRSFGHVSGRSPNSEGFN